MSIRARQVTPEADREEASADAAEMRRRLRAAAHEIRTPLAGAATIVDILAASELAEGRTADYVRLLKQAIEQLVAVTNDMLDLGRVEADLGLGPREGFSPAALLRSVAETARLRAAGRGLALSIEADGLPARVTGHPVMLRRIVENLLDNALKHTGEGTIRLSAAMRGERELVIDVVNPGEPIAAADLPLIFEPYVQLPSGQRAGGTGLGLALVKAAAARVGGTVSVESDAAATRFRVGLPVMPCEPQPPAAPKGRQASRPLDILVAEDNPVNRIVAGTILGEFGHRVAFASDGHAALAALGAMEFDLVLMDIEMPGLDGLAALAAIRAGPGLRRPVPVVALSARGEEARGDLLARGFDDFVAKPIDPAALYAAVESATAHKVAVAG